MAAMEMQFSKEDYELKENFPQEILIEYYLVVVVSKSVYYDYVAKTQRTISVLGVGWFHLNCMMHLKQGHVLQRDNRDLWSTRGVAGIAAGLEKELTLSA